MAKPYLPSLKTNRFSSSKRQIIPISLHKNLTLRTDISVLFIIFMRNIKISFEHPDYIYPFKLSVNAAHSGEIDSKSCKLAEQAL